MRSPATGQVSTRALVSAGLRGDRVETKNEGGFFGDRSTSHDALSGYTALTVGPFRDITTYFQVARGFRDPLLSEELDQSSPRSAVLWNQRSRHQSCCASSSW